MNLNIGGRMSKPMNVVAIEFHSQALSVSKAKRLTEISVVCLRNCAVIRLEKLAIKAPKIVFYR